MSKLTIKEIEEKLFNQHNNDPAFIESLQKDERKGVQQRLLRWMKIQEKEQMLADRFHQMMEMERSLREQGYQYIAGVDEVGRGPLAGPVVAAAVILSNDFYLPGINDSKQVKESDRDYYFHRIMDEAIDVGVGIISSQEIDELNIYQATLKAMKIAVESLKIKPDFLLVDAMQIPVSINQRKCIKGDENSITIAASSIIAKVTRDRLMRELSYKYPEYKFEQNMGYGTPVHLQAIEEHGIIDEHRKSFSPIKEKCTLLNLK